VSQFEPMYGRKKGRYKITSSFHEFVDWVRCAMFPQASGTKVSQSTFDNNFCFSCFVRLLHFLSLFALFFFRYTWLVFLSLRKIFSQVGFEDHLSLQQNENSRASFPKISLRLIFRTIFKRGEDFQSNSPYENVQIYIFGSSSSQNMSVRLIREMPNRSLW
jgi:hypothetical protein